MRELSLDIARIIKPHPDGVSLIGWSLGGLYAREVAKSLSADVRQVITLGSPFADVSGSTNIGWLFELLSGGPIAVDEQFSAMLKTPPPVPTTSIYSRSDGVVGWQACVLDAGAHAENIEVDSSHLGLVWHPDVLRIVADRLAQRRRKWKPWKSPSAVDAAPKGGLASAATT